MSEITRNFQKGKADYAAGTETRFRRKRQGLGGRADAHLTDAQFWTIREYARAMDRDDAIVGQLVDRAVDNVVHTGFSLVPETGSEELDLALRRKWKAWGSSKEQTDIAARFNFAEMERMVLRTRFIDGDIFALPLDSGHLQLIEGDRCQTPRTTRNVILGVMLDPNDRPLEYWFASEWRRDRKIQLVRDVERWPAYQDGKPHAFHVYQPARVTQTRGLTAFKAIFDVAGMFEDIQFANVVKQQIIACFCLFLKRSADAGTTAFELGSQESQNRADGTAETLESVEPGMIMKGDPGDEMDSFSPNVPGEDWHDHMRLILRMIGAQSGMPLELVLIDLSDTTFHGYRGALDQARRGFERTQEGLANQFHRPVYRWKVDRWLDPASPEHDEQLATLAADKGVDDPFAHSWKPPRWRYIEPKKDAEANKIRKLDLQASPSQIASEQQLDWDQVVVETVRDNSRAISAAIAAATEISDATGVAVSWREVLFLTAGDLDVPEQQAEAGIEEAEEGLGEPTGDKGNGMGKRGSRPALNGSRSL